MNPSFADIARSLGLEPQGLDLPPAVPVPAALLQLWREIGGNHDLLSGFQRFRLPNEVEVHDGNVLFLDEHQGVVVWAVPCAGDDPPVLQYPVGDEGQLEGPYPEDATLGDFLRAVLVMQATHGHVLPYAGSRARAAGSAQVLVDAGLTALAPVGELQPFIGAGIAVSVMSEDDGEVVFVAARTSEDLARLLELL